MKAQLFATFDSSGFVKASRNAGSVGDNEIGVMIAVEIPDRAFAPACDSGLVVYTLAAPEDET